MGERRNHLITGSAADHILRNFTKNVETPSHAPRIYKKRSILKKLDFSISPIGSRCEVQTVLDSHAGGITCYLRWRLVSVRTISLNWPYYTFFVKQRVKNRKSAFENDLFSRQKIVFKKFWFWPPSSVVVNFNKEKQIAIKLIKSKVPLSHPQFSTGKSPSERQF